jgi:hypothetical protein
MLRLRPCDHAPSPLFRRLPLALGAAAASLALVGCSYLPESLGGTAGGDDSEEGTERGDTAEQSDEDVPHDPTDAEAAIRAAVEQIETASDYDVFIVRAHESGDPFKSMAADHRYTNTPEEIVHSRLSGEGMLNIMYYSNSERDLWAVGDGFYEEITDPTPTDALNTDPALGAESLVQILETSTDLSYGGEGEVDLEYSVELAEGGYEPVEKTVPAHSYSGTFTSTVSVFEDRAGAYALTSEEHPAAPFTLWLNEEGLPVQLEHTSGEYTHTHTFIGVNEGLELTMPGPGDPAFP